MSRFNLFMPIILANENGATAAGYVNDPADRGGETICGITRKNHPELSVWQSLDKLQLWQKKKYKPTVPEMAEIYCVYRKSYYNKVRADEINDAALALQVFDCAVNCGVTRASKMLQDVVGTTQDGIIGPKTLAAANSRDYLEAYKIERVGHYMGLVMDGADVDMSRWSYRDAWRAAYDIVSKPGIRLTGNARFLKGWLNRVNNTHL